MPHFPSPSALTNKELVHYADLSLAQGVPLPLTWQEELCKRLESLSDHPSIAGSRYPSHSD